MLTGDEVKSLRAGRVSLKGAFAVVKGGELFMINCNISVYSHAYEKKEELATRSRKLLLHKKKLFLFTDNEGLVPEFGRRAWNSIPIVIGR